MKSYKIIKIITIILLIAIISVASFGGIYKLKEYKVIDVVPEYLLGMEFTDSRIVNFEVNKNIASTNIYDKDGNEVTEKQEGVEYTEENGYKIVENKVNSDDILTQENYKISKAVILNRLIALGTDQYTIKQNKDNGNIQIQMTENKNTDKIIYYLTQRGTFELTDNETEQILLDTSNIKDINVVYGQQNNETTVYLQIHLNKDGQAKLEEISKTYVESTVQTTNENGETEDVEQKKEVAVVLNGEKYRTTYFGEPITDGTLNIAIGSSSDKTTLQDYSLLASQIAIVLNSGILPIEYETTSYTVNSTITNLESNIVLYIVIVAILLMIIYSIIRLKANGALVGALQIGYIALLLLILRYTNIKITIEGIIGILVCSIINYMYIYKAFKNTEVDFIKTLTLKFSLKLIPVYIIAVIFTFNNIANISSLGMTLVWGIITMYLYNLVITNITVKTIEDK
ncbi:MAG: hypothetical protein Q4G09_01350 [Clostridia bacterium]|nr:hypothetical protein [Clostridia bacterium]